MDYEKFIEALRKEMDVKSQRELAFKLGVDETMLSRKKQTGISEQALAKILVKASHAAATHARREMIKPLVEFYPITCVNSLGETKYEFLPFKDHHEATVFQKGLRKQLQQACGIYIFYDSRGSALYVGKTKKNLWDEMKDAYNRERDLQMIRRVSFPDFKEFKPAYDQERKLGGELVTLAHLASYFSAYEIDNEMIDEIEALLIRGFANNVLNKKMETFGVSRKSGN